MCADRVAQHSSSKGEAPLVQRQQSPDSSSSAQDAVVRLLTPRRSSWYWETFSRITASRPRASSLGRLLGALLHVSAGQATPLTSSRRTHHMETLPNGRCSRLKRSNNSSATAPGDVSSHSLFWTLMEQRHVEFCRDITLINRSVPLLERK